MTARLVDFDVTSQPAAVLCPPSVHGESVLAARKASLCEEAAHGEMWEGE